VTKYKLKLNDRIFEVEADKSATHFDVGDDVHNALAEKIAQNNEKEENIFYEELIMMCSDCGITLHSEEEQIDGRCVQCEALHCCECDTSLNVGEDVEADNGNYMCFKCSKELEK